MNSYILISNKKRLKIFIFFNILFLLISLVIIEKIDIYFTDRGYFIEHKISKSRHMLNDAKKEKHDMIFIGHSKVQYHINSEMFREKGLNVYTYGIPSITISDYPYMVQKAIEAKPKVIVLDISMKRLYRGYFLPPIKNPTFFDIYIHFKATNIFAFPKNMYDFLPLNFYFSRYKDMIWQLNHPDEMKKTLEKVSKKYQYKSDCNNFFYRGKTRVVTLCTNGNGTIWADKKTALPRLFELTKSSIKQVELINYLIKVIQDNNIQVYLLLEETSYNRKLSFDRAELYDQFQIDKDKIFDITNLEFQDRLWADNGHLTAEGKNEFSAYLLKIFPIK